MFATSTKKLKFIPTDGMKVLVTGKISVFESTGQYQIYVNDMLEDGVGNLYIAFEQLKKKLEAEGLFREDIKKKIPKIPSRIGVVTAPTGAAIKDIISTIKRRWPLAEVYLFPSLVQGEDAKEDIVKQIKRAENYDLDTLIVGRAIYDCPIPVISAVGHEIDFTISDFVADLRAPTPTGAAEMAVPQVKDVENYLNQVKIRLNNTITNQLKHNRNKLNDLLSRNVMKNPIAIYQTKEMIFDNMVERLKYSLINLTREKEKELLRVKSSYILKDPYKLLDKKSNKLLNLIAKLEPLSPLKTIERGFGIVKKDNHVVTSVKDLKKKDNLELELKDGSVNVEVI